MSNKAVLHTVLAVILFTLIAFFQNCGLHSVVDSKSRESKPVSEKKVLYFGYYGGAVNGLGTGNYMSEFADHTNVVWVRGVDVPDTVAKLQEAKQRGLKVILYVNEQFFDFPATPILIAESSRRWKQLADHLPPFRETIVAFYPVDEPYMHAEQKGVDITYMKSYLELVGSTLKASFPEIAVATIFSHPEITKGYRPPFNYEWLGIDCYGPFLNCGGHSIPDLYEKLKLLKYSNQKLIVIPEAYLHGTSVSESELASRIDAYLAYSEKEPEVVGIFPFLYKGATGVSGVGDLPAIKERFRQFWRRINSTGKPTIQ